MLKRSLCSSLAIIYFLTLGTPLATLAQDHTAPVAEARNVETVTQSVQREPVQATELAAADRERVNVPVVDGEQRGRLPAETPSSPEVLPDARPLNLPTGPGQSAVTPQAIQLPQAEGSIRGMGESFSPSLSAGTGTYSVPIAVPAGRAGLQASLGLSYSTGGGNGPVGYGWSIGAPFIARQSDKGLPRYLDRAAWHVEEDRFFFNGGQELVPVSDADALALDGVGPPAECVGWQQYRARVEGGFMRFYRHFDTATQRTDRWLVFGKDGSRLELGAFSGGGPTEVASDPFNALQTENADGSGRVYMWYLVRTSDAHGASMYHRYRKDGGQQYLSEIYYTSPADCGVALNPAATRACARPLRDYAHRVALQYGAREDVSTSYLSTWRIRTALRLTRVDISAAMGAPSGGRSHVRRYHLTYKSGSWHSLLESVQMEGRPQTLDTDGIARGITNVPEGASDPRGERLPAMRFTYSEPRANTPPIAGFGGINATVMMSPSSPPSSVDETRADLFDVNSDGLTDLIVTDPARYRMPDGSPAVGVFFNGFTGTDARPAVAGGFSAAVPVPMPSSLSGVMTLSNLNIVPMDIDGDGRSDMLHMPRLRDYGYFTVTRGGASTDIETSPARQRFGFSYVPVTLPNSDQDPRIDLGRDGEHLRIMDVNQDHLVDVVRTAGTQMQTWLNLGWLKNPGSDDPIGDGRFGSARFEGNRWVMSTEPIASCLPVAGTPFDFNDPEARIADMNGDGLADLVRIRQGRVIYWPGRGVGLWGEGGTSCPAGFADGRYVEMATPPSDVSPDLDAIQLEDVNQDGLTDFLQVRFDAIDVWFNRGGESFTPRTTAANTPAAPSFAPRVRLFDIDGSGTSDIVFANAGRWQWIDPMGGIRPRLLVGVDNGLGATTKLEYSSSAQEYLRDLREAATCNSAACDRFTWNAALGERDAKLVARSAQSPTGVELYRPTGSPVVSNVVTAMETSDNFDQVGRDENVTRTEYRYHEAYYEGIEQEFRGFGVADAIAVGDVWHPTGRSRTWFLQGRRPNAIASNRLADNPDEALKGREYLTEVLDEPVGSVPRKYLSSQHASYRVRRLFTGQNGVAVSYAYVSRTDVFHYDTESGLRPLVDCQRNPASAGCVAFNGQERERFNGSAFVPDTTYPWDADSMSPRMADFVHTYSTSDVVDLVGNLLRQTDWGRGPLSQTPNTVQDEPIVARMVAQNLAQHESKWLWRTTESWTEGDAGAKLGNTVTTFNAVGDATQQTAVVDLLGASYEFGGDTHGAQGYSLVAQDLVSNTLHDAFGQPLASCGGTATVPWSGTTPPTGPGACLRFSTVTYETDYGMFPARESIAVGFGLTVDSSAIFDRGLGTVASVTDANGEESRVSYDGLGRMSSMTPPSNISAFDGRPTVKLEYSLGAPVSFVKTTTFLTGDAGAGDAGTLISYAYVDGLGRARAAVAEGSDNDRWVRTGVAFYSRRGTAFRATQGAFLSTGEPTPRLAVSVPSAPSAVSFHDAFGRVTSVFAEDGSPSKTTYKPLETTACDALDLDRSPANVARGTCNTTRTDGHGRTIDQVLRNRQEPIASIEYYRLYSYYRQDGTLKRIVRTGSGTTTDAASDRPAYPGLPATNVTHRDFTFDSVGRRLGATDPDSDSRDSEATDANKTWRYLFNRVGDLAAVRDPRGCGQNFYYDLAGRLIGEDYVECTEAQSSGEDPPDEDALPIGAIGMEPTAATRPVDVRMYFESYPEQLEFAPLTAALPSMGLAGTKGRLTAASDRGQRSLVGYDVRGNAIFGARIMAVMPDEIPLETTGEEPFILPSREERQYDTQHVYTRSSTFDFANRATSLVLPQDPDHLDRARVGGRLEYDERGMPYRAHVDFSVGGARVQTFPLVADTQFDFDGAPLSTRVGGPNAARQLVTEMEYDVRRRPVRMTTTRTPKAAALAILPVSESDYLSRVTTVADTELVWDAVSNLLETRDHRDPSEWPTGWQPRTIRARHDALYRVTSADMTYGDPFTGGSDRATNWRDDSARAREVDPMRSTPAPMLGELPDDRANNISWSYDWLGNATEWTDDANHFYERSIGDIDNGSDLNTTAGYPNRPSALYGASDLPGGGYLTVTYGESGNATEMVVYSRCATDAASCQQAQKYVYRWDELNRLVEGRRFDREMGQWTLKVRQRERYDGGNQRTVKETISDEGAEVPRERYTLYVHAGDYERRGLVLANGVYAESATLGTETQYLVGGARVIWKGVSHAGTDIVDGAYRITLPVTDLIGSVGAVWDLVSAELLEASTYYPNGARETLLTTAEAAVEPMGFTGKEADEEIGLTYFGERWLISRVGRWASADPAEVHAMQGGAAGNSYHYVSAKLLAARDPLGLQQQPALPNQGSGEASQAQTDAGSPQQDAGAAPQQPLPTPQQPPPAPSELQQLYDRLVAGGGEEARAARKWANPQRPLSDDWLTPDREGHRPRGEIPPGARSGFTIGYGYDLGRHDEQSIRETLGSIGLSQEYIDFAAGFAGRPHALAERHLAEWREDHPGQAEPTLTQTEAKKLWDVMRPAFAREAANRLAGGTEGGGSLPAYATSNPIPHADFARFDPAVRAVLTDFAYKGVSRPERMDEIRAALSGSPERMLQNLLTLVQQHTDWWDAPRGSATVAVYLQARIAALHDAQAAQAQVSTP